MVSYTDKNRKDLTRRYKSFERFTNELTFDDATIEALKAAGEKNKVGKFDQAQYEISAPD
ncbi:MAG: hypothetical protein U5L72_08445 [Bacteroidales bacterium]|nr:hypothetical protein [Bacteroidales bacterium]